MVQRTAVRLTEADSLRKVMMEAAAAQPRGRLVEEDERRVLRERDSQREAPESPRTSVAGERVLARCEAHGRPASTTRIGMYTAAEPSLLISLTASPRI